MGEHQRRQEGDARHRLVRGADGRLRSASEGYDIGDLWAEQRRIRLNEDILEDKKKAERRKQRGWKKYLPVLPTIPKVNPKPPTVVQPTNTAKPAGGETKTVEIKISLPSNISLPKLRKPKLPLAALRKVRAKLPKPSKRVVAVSLMAAVCAIVATAGLYMIFGRHSGSKVAQNGSKSATGTLGASHETPQYATLIPHGKSIDRLGGWTRVSPPGKNPVFAYVDHIDSVQVNVSEQPLPDSFTDDVTGQVAKLADSFAARDKLSANNTTVYVGTSLKGPQSVITTKANLLILIKSATKVPDDKWVAYVNSLQ